MEQIKSEAGKEEVKVGHFGEFDAEYFFSLEEEDGWSAFSQEGCENVRYFTVYGGNSDEERLGIVGVYDYGEDKNIVHGVVDPRFRGRGLAAEFYKRLLHECHLPFLTMTINANNAASLRSMEKLQGVQRVSDDSFEQATGKVKFLYKEKE